MLGAEGSLFLNRLSVAETITLIAGLRDLSNAMAAVQARALVRLEAAVKEDCLAREETPRAALKIARAEASFAVKASPAAAGQTMSSSRRLVHSMPGMLSAVAHGQMSAAAAHRVGRVVGPASPELRSQVDEVLTEHLPYLEDCGVQEWGGETEKVMHSLDPEGAQARHLRTKRERGLSVRRAENGMAVLTARITALDGARIRKGISLAAEKARAHGDRRGHQQIMADLLADTLIGRGTGPPTAQLDIGVIITDRSLFAPAHADSATIEGIGPVPYEHIREEMLQAMSSVDGDKDLQLALRNLYADPEDGQLVAVESRSRAFPPALSRFIRWSHLTCRAPYCDADIRQNDHITPFSQGGATSMENGNGLCGADNQKEEAGETARVISDSDGRRRTVEWTTRYGQKARRGGNNVDLVGTARRRKLQREQVETTSTAATPEPGRTVPGTWASRGLDDVTSWDAGADLPPELDGPMPRALHRIARRAYETSDPHPFWRNRRVNRHRLLCGRTDYVFDAILMAPQVAPEPEPPYEAGQGADHEDRSGPGEG